MLGGWDAWLHSSIAGLDAAVNGSVHGWKEITVRVSPGVIPELKAVSSERQTPFGKVEYAAPTNYSLQQAVSSIVLESCTCSTAAQHYLGR